jgi:hypothetical protein
MPVLSGSSDPPKAQERRWDLNSVLVQIARLHCEPGNALWVATAHVGIFRDSQEGTR